MEPITIDQIDKRLKELPPEKLSVENDFVSHLAAREIRQGLLAQLSDRCRTTY